LAVRLLVDRCGGGGDRGPLYRGKGRTLARPNVAVAGLSSGEAFRVRGRGRRVPHLVRRLRAVGGEWFAMWQSEVWNGQQPAFRICVFILLCTLIVGQKEYDG
jgi:hypothetical protein